MRKLPLRDLPQTIGRDPSLYFSVNSPGVSRRHATIEASDTGQLSIQDLRSSNGTYLNRVRIEGQEDLFHGDILHFGELELRLINQNHTERVLDEDDRESVTVFVSPNNLSQTFPAGVLELEELLEKRKIIPYFQPILKSDGTTLHGYELLARGDSEKISASPLGLFTIAESFGLEVQLSELMRDIGAEAAATAKLGGSLWLNTHPNEVADMDRLLESLRRLRKSYPSLQLVFEVHEQCVANRDALRVLKSALQAMSIQFAFDDFGVGQSRITELVDSKPDIIKFDRVLLQDVSMKDDARISLLRKLKEMAADLGITTLAEGVETEQEYQVCEHIGFDLYQGYLFAKPSSMNS